MIRLKLKRTDLVLVTIPRYQRFLASSELKIIEQLEDIKNGTIELVIDARLYGVKKWATRLAYDCFDNAVISVIDSNDAVSTMFFQPQ